MIDKSTHFKQVCQLLLSLIVVSGQDWARKFVTFQLVSAISRNETGLLRDILRSLRVKSLIYSRNKQRILHGRTETRNFSSSVKKHFTSERSFRTVL